MKGVLGLCAKGNIGSSHKRKKYRTRSILGKKDDKFSFIHSEYKESRNNLAGMSVLKERV